MVVAVHDACYGRRKKMLQKPKGLGGMALLNFQFWAANLCPILYWTKLKSPDPIPAWLGIESFSSAPLSLSALLYLPFIDPPPRFNKNIIVANSVKIWRQFIQHHMFQHLSLLAPSTPIHCSLLPYMIMLLNYAAMRVLVLSKIFT